ncbi:hypothetical protein BJV77DRAFT_963184 [Russula vinacea]|nr:hypothetical protein BJV77DRAFT_963184 [Russula vinacea]
MPLTNPSSKSSKLEAATAQSAKDNADEYMTAVPSSTIATVPGYWLIALRNHVGLSELITDRESWVYLKKGCGLGVHRPEYTTGNLNEMLMLESNCRNPSVKLTFTVDLCAQDQLLRQQIYEDTSRIPGKRQKREKGS